MLTPGLRTLSAAASAAQFPSLPGDALLSELSGYVDSVSAAASVTDSSITQLRDYAQSANTLITDRFSGASNLMNTSSAASVVLDGFTIALGATQTLLTKLEDVRGSDALRSFMTSMSDLVDGPLTSVIASLQSRLRDVTALAQQWTRAVTGLPSALEKMASSLASAGTPTPPASVKKVLPTCASPTDVSVPPCIHSASRMPNVPNEVFVAQFFKLSTLLSSSLHAPGAYDGYTLAGADVLASNGNVVLVYNPVRRLQSASRRVGPLLVVVSSGGNVLRQVALPAAATAVTAAATATATTSKFAMSR